MCSQVLPLMPWVPPAEDQLQKVLSSEAQARARVAELERQNHEVEQSFAAHENRLAQNEVATYHDLTRLEEERSELGEPGVVLWAEGESGQVNSCMCAKPAWVEHALRKGLRGSLVRQLFDLCAASKPCHCRPCLAAHHAPGCRVRKVMF